MSKDFNDTLNEKLKDPEYCRVLLDDLRKMVEENERMRKSLRRIKTVSESDGWKDDIIEICNKAAKEGLK